MDFIRRFTEVSQQDVECVGGKNASLGEMIGALSSLGVKVPAGFATTAAAYQHFIKKNKLDDFIQARLQSLDVEDIPALQSAGHEIRQAIIEATLPEDVVRLILKEYMVLDKSGKASVAVRSSATAEDLPEASFAGQQDTYLNISGEKALRLAVKKVYASLFTDRAIAYRVHQQFAHEDVSISVGIQQMVRSDIGSSGVAFTLDTESGFDQVIFITAAYGLGETVVQGQVNPDEFYVHKPTLEKGFASIIGRTLGQKAIKLVYTDGEGIDSTKEVDVSDAEQQRFCLNDEEVLSLATQALAIEQHYGCPMDIEWAKDGNTKDIFIVQARPETVQAREDRQVLEQYRLTESATPLVIGRSVGQKIGQGVARVIDSPEQMDILKAGEILVTDMTDPDWEPVMKRASAIVTNRGGRTCHAAIIARELGIPAVVGCGDATTKIPDGERVTASCAEGEKGFVYPGELQFDVDKTKIDQLPDLPVKLCMNLANPEQAFLYQFLPNEGVGLARLEFIIGNRINVHPNGVLHFDALPDDVKKQVSARASAYDSPKEFYIEKLAEGVATIAAAFYPKPIIVRFSDFKSNEYANLLAGDQFEPKEENPMIGYRGASRYVSGNFTECFLLEIEAIKRVREQKGLTNTHVMFPFVRTVEEAKQLLAILEQHGLKRGENDLKLYMMCEIPSNAVLADEFLPLFDGYSIGSNDLTQLTLGLDRDSELVADIFDERNAAVLVLLKQIIEKCRAHGKYVGICGQGPSDHPDFAQWLLEQGIESMSLTPDSIVKTWMALADE